MKRKNMKLHIIFIIIMSFIFNASLALALDDSTNVASINEQIIKFNSEQQELFKEIIMEDFKGRISGEELDSLIIVAEPKMLIDEKCKTKHIRKIPKDAKYEDFKDLYPNAYEFRKKITRENLIRYDIRPTEAKHSIYSCISGIDLNKDSLNISFRIYNSKGIQLYYMEISKPGLYTPLVSGWSYVPNKTFLKLDSSNQYASCPIGMTCFTIPDREFYFTFVLNRHYIFNNKIYSIHCMMDKFRKLSVGEILKDHINEIEDCEIDKYLSSPH